jgi:hypothetical protein
MAAGTRCLAMEALEEADIINNHPIKEGLVTFHHQFESSRARLGFVGSSPAVENILSTESVYESRMETA